MRSLSLRNAKTLRNLLVILPPFIWMSLVILLPMIIVLAISFSEYSASIPPYKLFISYNDELSKYSFKPIIENYQIFFEDNIYILSLLNSFKYAIITTFITLLVGYPVALAIADLSPASKTIILTLIILPFWTSLIIRVYAWKIILGNSGIINNTLIYMGMISDPIQFLNSDGAVIAGLVYCYLPFMIFPLFVALERIDKSYIEAAQDLGYTPFQAFFKVTLPMSKSGIIAGCMLVFIPCVGEYVVPELLGGGKIMNIGKIIWLEFFQNKDWTVASAVTVIMCAVFIVPLIIVQRFITDDEHEVED